jgi:hypothetical protein
MPPDESKAERTWAYIESRKRANGAHKNGHNSAATNGSSCDPEALFVDAVSQALIDADGPPPLDASPARAQLSMLLSAAQVRPAPRPPRRSFWNVSGSRQVVLAIVLLLITIAALGYVTWSATSPACNTQIVPPTLPGGTLKAPAPAPRPMKGRRGVRSAYAAGKLRSA